jgi:hypothetical protein
MPRHHVPQPGLLFTVVIILLVSGISPSAWNAHPAGIACSATTSSVGPCTGRLCLRVQGGGESQGCGAAADVPGQVRPPILHGRSRRTPALFS